MDVNHELDMLDESVKRIVFQAIVMIIRLHTRVFICENIADAWDVSSENVELLTYAKVPK